MQEAEYGLTSGAFGNNGDEQLLVKFFLLPVQNTAKSEEAGRPIFEEKLHIEKRVPGNKDSVVCRKIREKDKQQFAKQWEMYSARTSQDEAIVGTLLEEWPGVTRSQVEELKFYNIRTVEQLASMSDSNAQNFRGAPVLKQKASAYLKSSMSNEQLSAQLKEANEKINKLIAAQEANEDAAAVLADVELGAAASEEAHDAIDEPKKRRGRKPKAVEE